MDSPELTSTLQHGALGELSLANARRRQAGFTTRPRSGARLRLATMTPHLDAQDPEASLGAVQGDPFNELMSFIS